MTERLATVPPQSGARGRYWRQAHGYPIAYTVADGGTLCGKCATEEYRGEETPDAFRCVAWELCDDADAATACDHCGAALSPEEE